MGGSLRSPDGRSVQSGPMASEWDARLPVEGGLRRVGRRVLRSGRVASGASGDALEQPRAAVDFGIFPPTVEPDAMSLGRRPFRRWNLCLLLGRAAGTPQSPGRAGRIPIIHRRKAIAPIPAETAARSCASLVTAGAMDDLSAPFDRAVTGTASQTWPGDDDARTVAGEPWATGPGPADPGLWHQERHRHRPPPSADLQVPADP